MMNGEWKLYLDTGKWRWRCKIYGLQEPVKSPRTFDRYTDCLVDACSNGYVLPSPKTAAMPHLPRSQDGGHTFL
jgi:hypothetical protein